MNKRKEGDVSVEVAPNGTITIRVVTRPPTDAALLAEKLRASAERCVDRYVDESAPSKEGPYENYDDYLKTQAGIHGA